MADKEKTDGREAVNLEVGIVIRELERIRNSTSLEKERLIAAHPNWDSEKDARITSFSKFINVLNSTGCSCSRLPFLLRASGKSISW